MRSTLADASRQLQEAQARHGDISLSGHCRLCLCRCTVVCLEQAVCDRTVELEKRQRGLLRDHWFTHIKTA